jgi:hypothetical protein
MGFVQVNMGESEVEVRDRKVMGGGIEVCWEKCA